MGKDLFILVHRSVMFQNHVGSEALTVMFTHPFDQKREEDYFMSYKESVYIDFHERERDGQFASDYIKPCLGGYFPQFSLSLSLSYDFLLISRLTDLTSL